MYLLVSISKYREGKKCNLENIEIGRVVKPSPVSKLRIFKNHPQKKPDAHLFHSSFPLFYNLFFVKIFLSAASSATGSISDNFRNENNLLSYPNNQIINYLVIRISTLTTSKDVKAWGRAKTKFSRSQT